MIFKYLLMDWLLSVVRTDQLISTDVGILDRWMSYEELLSTGMFNMHYISEGYYLHVDYGNNEYDFNFIRFNSHENNYYRYMITDHRINSTYVAYINN